MASCLKTKDSPLKQNLEKLEGGRWPDHAKRLGNTIEMDRSGHNSWDGQDQFNCETATYSSSRGMMQPEGMDPKGRDMSKQQSLKRESFATRRPGRLSKTKNMEFGVDHDHDHQEAKEELQPSMNYDGLFPNNKRLEDHVSSNFIDPEDKNPNPRLSSSSSSRPKPTFEYEILVECYDSQQVDRLQAAILKSSKILNESVLQPPKKLNKMQEKHVKRHHASYPKKSPSRPILLYKLLLKCSDPTQIKTIYGALLESSIVLNSCVYSSKGNECVPCSRMKNIVEPVEMMNTPTHRGSLSSSNHTGCGQPSLTPIEDQRDHLQTPLCWPCKEVAPKGIGSHGWNEMRKSTGMVSLPYENSNDKFKVNSENCLNLGGIGRDAISTWCDHVDESMNKLASCGKKRQLSKQLFDELSMLESLFSQCEDVSQAQCKERRFKFPECLQVPTKDNLEQTQPHDDQFLKEDNTHLQAMATGLMLPYIQVKNNFEEATQPCDDQPHKEDKNRYQAMAPKMMSPYIQRPSCNPEYFVALEDPYCRPSTSFQAVNVTPKKNSQCSTTINAVAQKVQVECATLAAMAGGDVESPQIAGVKTTAIDAPHIVDSETQSDDVIVISNDVAMGNVSKADIKNQIADIFSCDDDDAHPSSGTHHEDFPTFASSENIGQQIANIIANAPTNIDAMSDTQDLCGPSVCLLPSAMGLHFGNNVSNQSNDVDTQNSSTQDDFKVLEERSSIAQQPSEVGVQTSTPAEDETFLGWLARTTGIDVTSNASQTSPREPKEEHSWWTRMGVSVETKMDESEPKTVDDAEQQQQHVDTSQNEAQSAWWINPFTSLQATVIDQFKFETVSSISEQRKSILNSFYEEILTQSQGSPPQTESKKFFTTETLSKSGNFDPKGAPSFTTETPGDSDDLQTERNMFVTTQNQLENNPQIERKFSETNEHLEIIPLPTKPNHPHVVRKMSLPVVENAPNGERRMSHPIEENPQIENRMSQPMVENPINAEREMSLPVGENPQTERRMSLTIIENPPNAERRMSHPIVVPTKENPHTEKMISLITSQNPHDVERNIPLPTGVENSPQVVRRAFLPTGEENPHVDRLIVEKPQSNPQPTEKIRISLVSGTTTQNQIFENKNSHIPKKNSLTTKVKPETSDKAMETNLDWIPYILGTSPPQLKKEFGSHKISMGTIGGMKRELVTKDVQTIGRVGSNVPTSNQVSDSSNSGITTSLHT